MILDIGTFDSCWGIIELTQANILSTDDIVFNSETVSLYPNPANRYVDITNASMLGVSSIKIYNVQGELIMNNVFQSAPIDISALASGFYLVEINNDSGDSVVKKLIKN
nr:T9SS type A sorting domain-containing protein [Aquimarina sp. MMG015]